jgi:uncharacterized protein YdeI (YjbR/CyaY-like superfamily)
MGKRSARVDEYIASSADFAKPILEHLRELIHKGCPDVVETIKWGAPSFDYKGPFFGFARFKEHCAFGFWKAKLLKDPVGYSTPHKATAWGSFGKIRSIHDLPPNKIILDFIKQAKKLNDDGVKLPARKKKSAAIVIPSYFSKALRSNKKAMATFQAFSPSNKRDYIEWITEAKTTITREKRLKTALEWLVQGKVRNWKYLNK